MLWGLGFKDFRIFRVLGVELEFGERMFWGLRGCGLTTFGWTGEENTWCYRQGFPDLSGFGCVARVARRVGDV